MKKEKTYYATRNEEKVIAAILDKIGAEDKWCVEFGAWDGKYGSNTFHFIKDMSFKGVFIEGDKDKYKILKKNIKPYDVISLCRYVSFEGENSLDNLLASTEIPYDFSILSIDIDGNDYYVWESFKKYKPKVVVIEYNPSIPNEVDFVQEKDVSINQGCSASALVRLAKDKGYELISTNLNNLFFVDEKYFHLFNINDNSLNKLRIEQPRVTYIFNGYDGKVFIRGYGKLDLYSIDYNESKMQVIPFFLQEWDTKSSIKRFFQRIHRSLKKRNLI